MPEITLYRKWVIWDKYEEWILDGNHIGNIDNVISSVLLEVSQQARDCLMQLQQSDSKQSKQDVGKYISSIID